eukprot:scaffold9857_cov127-Cylindrotheca_fusiformis.AAC.1
MKEGGSNNIAFCMTTIATYLFYFLTENDLHSQHIPHKLVGVEVAAAFRANIWNGRTESNSCDMSTSAYMSSQSSQFSTVAATTATSNPIWLSGIKRQQYAKSCSTSFAALITARQDKQHKRSAKLCCMTVGSKSCTIPGRSSVILVVLSITMSVEMETCPASAPFFGFMGVTSALVFANIGAAYGTAKSGVGISSMGVMNPGLVMRNIIPVVMAGVLGIYGLIVAVIIQGSI